MINYRKINQNSSAIYLNFPFCKTPCLFCHYTENINFGYDSIPNDYFQKLCNQLEEILKEINNTKVKSIYLGGGTPSLLNDKQIFVLQELFKKYNVTALEISIELHPKMCNFDYENNQFFTRYSIGVQTLDTEEGKRYRRLISYDFELIEMIKKIKKNQKIINLDFIFDEKIEEKNINFVNYINPDTVTFYPNTKGKGLQRLRNIIEELKKLKEKLIDYYPLGECKHIFLRKKKSQSLYSKVQYEENGDIIGVGHNSISYINNDSYLCIYKENEFIFKNRRKKGERIFSSLLMGIVAGVSKKYVSRYMPDIYKEHYLLTLDKHLDINEKHTKINDDTLIYLPDSEYIRFYNWLKKNYSVEYQNIFLSSIGYGDNDIETIEQVYNKEFRKNINNEIKIFDKIKTPQIRILVEGIDGSGKDTFVNLFIKELKKYFIYDYDSKISVLGQPDSKCKYGLEAKGFIEDYKIIENDKITRYVLSQNRENSEEKITKLDGIIILIRGLVTDKATFIKKFNYDDNLGEGKIISLWDMYIVIDIDVEIADKRIEKRGIPRTWREYKEHLEYFRNFYLNYQNKLFKRKVIIYNDCLVDLQKRASELAEKLYEMYR